MDLRRVHTLRAVRKNHQEGRASALHWVRYLNPFFRSFSFSVPLWDPLSPFPPSPTHPPSCSRLSNTLTQTHVRTAPPARAYIHACPPTHSHTHTCTGAGSACTRNAWGSLRGTGLSSRTRGTGSATRAPATGPGESAPRRRVCVRACWCAIVVAVCMCTCACARACVCMLFFYSCVRMCMYMCVCVCAYACVCASALTVQFYYHTPRIYCWFLSVETYATSPHTH